MIYCGRKFSDRDLERIRQIIEAPDKPHRLEISRRVCRDLRWLRPNGALKDMSCRVALLRMERDGLIKLPPPLKRNGNGKDLQIRHTSQTDPGEPIVGTVDCLDQLALEPVRDQKRSQLWNELIDRYHYLGYTPLNGAQQRYLIAGNGQILGALGFAAAAWKMAPRDQWIGWNTEARQANLMYIANNYRFLILPWVQVKNLASKTLSLAAKQLPEHWNQRYGHKVYLLETLVETGRFQGTCYRAANWINLGQTTGRGKWDRDRKTTRRVKDIYVLPLAKNAKTLLARQTDVPQ